MIATRRRSLLEGSLAILRFNWPFYVAGSGLLAAATAFSLSAEPSAWRALAWIAILVTGWFLVASLAVSHVVYDRSDVYRFGWLGRIPGLRAGHCLSCHAGYDDSSASLRAGLTGSTLDVLDHYDAGVIPAESIRRARRRYPVPPASRPAPIAAWPVADGRAAGIFALFAIHELRREPDRVLWFREARRALAPGGRILLVEHVRDLANLAVFGPGFLHFHSPSTWRRAWEAAGLRALDELRITPFVRVFVLAEP